MKGLRAKTVTKTTSVREQFVVHLLQRRVRAAVSRRWKKDERRRKGLYALIPQPYVFFCNPSYEELNVDVEKGKLTVWYQVSVRCNDRSFFVVIDLLHNKLTISGGNKV